MSHPTLKPHLFQKKVTVVEAMQFDGSGISQVAIKNWAGDAVQSTWDGEDFGVRMERRQMKVETLHGITDLKPGDWIVKGEAGDFWPVHRDLFHSLYEAVDPRPDMTVIS